MVSVHKRASKPVVLNLFELAEDEYGKSLAALPSFKTDPNDKYSTDLNNF